MLNSDTDDPYGQPKLPYQPYRQDYDPWLSQSQKLVSSPTTPMRPGRPVQAQAHQQRMSKAEALEFVDRCKRWLIAGSIVAFGILGGLVAGQLAGTSSSQAAPGPSTSPTTPSSGGYFQQQQGGGGYGFGNGNNWQPPVSSSRTS